MPPQSALVSCEHDYVVTVFGHNLRLKGLVMKHNRSSLFLAALVCLSTHSAVAQTKYSLKKNQLVTVSGNKLCGLIKSKWSPVKKSGKRFIIDKKNNKRCKTLLSPSALKKSGLALIPSASSLLKARPSASTLAVSGTARYSKIFRLWERKTSSGRQVLSTP